MKKFSAFILAIVLCFSLSIPSLAAVSGYGQAKNKSNTPGIIDVKVTKDWYNNGYGLTLKTSGSGTAIMFVTDPNNDKITLCSSSFNCYDVTMNDTDERAWNLKGVKSGVYQVHYTVIGGPLTIQCHIYG